MRKALAGLAVGMFFVGLAGCSGGGGGGGGGSGGSGGGGGTAPLQYTGNSSPANIDQSNAALLAAAATNSAGTAEITGVVSGVAPGGGSQQGEGIIDVGRRVAHSVRKLGARPSAEARLTSAPFDETGDCPQGGTLRIFGDVTPAGTGTINFTFTNCGIDGDVLSGTMTVSVFQTLTGPGPDDLLPLDSTLSFGRLSLRGSANIDIGGTIRLQINVPENKETITQNVVALNLDTGRMIKSEVTFVDTYDNVRNEIPILLTHSINGRVFDSTHGFVTIETLAVLRFTTATQIFPSGGELILTGANNRRIQVVPNSATRVTLGLDLDGNGLFRQVRLAWADLLGPIGRDLGDTDGDRMHNSWETQFGMLPSVNDADGNPDGDEFNNLAEYVGGGNPNNGTKPALVVGAPVPAASDFAGAFTPSTMSGSAIASDGTNFLIVSCKQDVAGGLGVFGILISETGRVGSNFQISADLCPQQPAVAFDGTNYLVVVARGGQLFGISVTPAGVSNPPGKPITSNVGNSFPSIVFDGENYLVAWHNFSGSSSIRGARVNKAGDVLDAEFPISSVGNESAPMVAFGATNYLVVWSNQTTGSENVFGALVPKAGAVVAPAAFPIANGVDSQVAGGVAFDGTNYLVVWDHQPGTGGGQIAARRVTPDGTLLPDGRADTAGITITAPTGNHSSSVAFAGSTFVVTWARGGSSPSQGPAGVFAARVSKAGDQIDFALQDSGVTVSGSPAFTRFFHPVIASKGQSQNALIAWIRNDDLGTLNDVLAAPVISP